MDNLAEGFRGGVLAPMHCLPQGDFRPAETHRNPSGGQLEHKLAGVTSIVRHVICKLYADAPLFCHDPHQCIAMTAAASSLRTALPEDWEPTMPDQRYDRLVLATISVLRTLVFELSRRGILDQAEFVSVVRETAIAHREAGDPNNLADAIQAISKHLEGSITAP